VSLPPPSPSSLAPPNPTGTTPAGPAGGPVKSPELAASDTSFFSLGNALRLLLKHAFWVLVFSIAGPAIAAVYVNRQVKVYEATATIVYDFSQPNTLGRHVDVFDPYSDYFNKQELMETEFRIITSMRVARQVVVDTGLDVDRVYLAAAFPGVPPESIKPEAIANSIRGRTKVESVRGTHLAKISFEDGDPARAQRLVTSIIEAYVRISNEDAVGTTGTALEWLNNQTVKLQRELEDSELALHEFKFNRNLLSVSMTDQNNLLRDEITAVHAAVTAANIKRAQLLSRANALSKVTRANPDDLPAQELLSDGALVTLRTNYQTARTELTVLRSTGKMDNHPDVQIAQARLDDALGAFLHQVRNIQAAALREAAVASAEAGSLQGLLESARNRALDLNLQEIHYNRLHRAAVTNEKLYSNVLERMKEVDISRMINVKNIKMLDAPQLPGAPIRPKVPSTIGVGAAAGLLVGLLIAVVRELADRTIKTPFDIETKLGLTSLGLLPETATHQGKSGPKRRRGALVNPEGPAELLVADNPTSSMAEAARSIRSNIMFMSPDKPPRMILVTSAGVGEGKTTTATTLATTFAQAGARVLLVDLDLRRPRLHRIFNTGPHGVTSVLLGEETLAEAIRPSPVPNVSILAAGRVPPNPAELLMSEKLADMLMQLRGMFDRIIIDSPPVNPITDAVILSTRVDGTVFVVRSFKTTLEQVRHAVRSLADVKAHVLGVILNAVDLGKLEYKYSYYYRYYGGYTQDKPDGKPDDKPEVAA
jgi:polysaccharide biosynthesis transport protein